MKTKMAKKLTKMEIGGKIFLDENLPDPKQESNVNDYLGCRDGVVEAYTYRDTSGYGSLTRLFLCQNAKHDTSSIIRQTYDETTKVWREEELVFDDDSLLYLKALLTGIPGKLTDEFLVVRDYTSE